MKILKQIKCSDRLPDCSKSSYFYETVTGDKGMACKALMTNQDYIKDNHIKYWYEEVEDTSIMDYENAYKITSSLIMENQGLKLKIEREAGKDCVIAPIEVVQERAKERYDKAFSYAETQTCAGFVCIDLDTVDEALKIAAGLETD